MDSVNISSFSMQINKFTEWNLHPNVKEVVKKTCFNYFMEFPTAKVNIPKQMLVALLCFYNSEEECFVFAENTKVDIGLEDILYITGLPIDGKQVSGTEHDDPVKTIVDHLSISSDEANDLLTFSRAKQSHDISLEKLKEKFSNVDVSNENLHSHVKAYLLYLLGNVLFCTSSFKTISVMYLPFLELADIDSYAWGAAVLATLKVSMGKVRNGQKTLSGFAYPLMVFAFERFKCLRELRSYATPSEFPLMLGWANLSSADLRKRAYMPDLATCYDKLQEITNEDVDWFPYKRVDLEGALPVPLQHQFWMVYAKVYTICFENIAKHPVDICWQQLGLQQEEVKRDIADFKPIKLKQRGQKKKKDWRNATKFYTHCNMRWENRNMFLIKEGLYFNEPDVQYDNFDHNHVLDEDDNVGNHDQNQDDNSDQSDGGDNSDHNDGDEDDIDDQDDNSDQSDGGDSNSSQAHEALPIQTPPHVDNLDVNVQYDNFDHNHVLDEDDNESEVRASTSSSARDAFHTETPAVQTSLFVDTASPTQYVDSRDHEEQPSEGFPVEETIEVEHQNLDDGTASPTQYVDSRDHEEQPSEGFPVEETIEVEHQNLDDVAQTPSNGSRCNTFNFSPETAEISPDDQRSISSVYPGKNQRKNQRKKQKTSRK